MIFCSRVSGYRLLFFVGSSILVTFVFSAIAFPILIAPTQALPKASSQIPYQISANQEDIVVSGEKGKYVARILVDSSKENVWKILIDYTKHSSYYTIRKFYQYILLLFYLSLCVAPPRGAGGANVRKPTKGRRYV